MINVICIKWGTKYSARDVNLLYRMVLKNTHEHDIAFHCFTDDDSGIDSGVIIHPIPDMDIDQADNIHNYRKEAGLCDDNLARLNGQRVFFLDLDVVITGALDVFFTYPKGDKFYIINDWNTNGDHVGQASFYSWQVGTLGYVKSDFEAQPRKWIDEFGSASQEYLSYKVIEKTGDLNFWPAEWVQSFKFNSLPPWYARAFVMPRLPEGTRILVFHGDPKPDDAIIGRWADHVPFHKRIYKTIRSSPWIKPYLDV